MASVQIAPLLYGFCVELVFVVDVQIAPLLHDPNIDPVRIIPAYVPYNIQVGI